MVRLRRIYNGCEICKNHERSSSEPVFGLSILSNMVVQHGFDCERVHAPDVDIKLTNDNITKNIAITVFNTSAALKADIR